MMTETVLAKLVVTRSLPDRRKFVATAQLHQLQGNQRPYFSVTGELLNLRKHPDNQIEACGVMDTEIRRYFPYLAPVLRLHLADDNGVPMHVVDNAAYWLGFTEWKKAEVRKDPEKGLETVDLPWFPYFESLWRIDRDEALDARSYVKSYCTGRADQAVAAKEALGILACAMLPRWKAEAEAALAVIERGRYE